VLVASFAAATLAHGQGWPTKTVKIIVPYPPGGAVDVVTRKMASKLQEQTGQAFIVENKAGATGTIGIMQAIQSPADGYTLVANDSTYALLPHIFKKLPFDYGHDLLPIGAFVFAPMSAVVKAESKYRTLGELIAAAKVWQANLCAAVPACSTSAMNPTKTSCSSARRASVSRPAAYTSMRNSLE